MKKTTTTSTLLIIVGILLPLLVMTSSTTTTLTPAYAQSRACPEGFELNRGVCQAEPTLSCEQYGEDYELFQEEFLGLVCRLVEVSEPICIAPTGQVGIWDPVFPGRCLTPLGNPSGVQPVCEQPGVSVTLVPGTNDQAACVKITRETPIPTCDIGELNEESEMCEIRPGNRR